MIAVIFEVEPWSGQRDAYLGLAAEMRPMLDEIDGFISIERFQSLSNPEKLLSLSVFRDEAAVSAWRTHPSHRRSQGAGRATIFADYRLRVVSVLRDYTMTDRSQAPADSRAIHDMGWHAGRDTGS
jgi:heme-degrading monooxygenase HmoA